MYVFMFLDEASPSALRTSLAKPGELSDWEEGGELAKIGPSEKNEANVAPIYI